jgi:hypothetical protein
MAIDVNVVQLELYLKRLISRIAKNNILVELDVLLNASQAVAPSRVGTPSFSFALFLLLLSVSSSGTNFVVPGVGKIFECYLHLASTPKFQDLFSKRAANGTVMTFGGKEQDSREVRFALCVLDFLYGHVSLGRKNSPAHVLRFPAR